MDGREGMSLPGSSPYYLNRGGIFGSSNVTGSPSVHVTGGSSSSQPSGPNTQLQPIFRPHSNPNNIPLQSNVRISGGISNPASFQFENPSPPNYPSQGMISRVVSSGGGDGSSPQSGVEVVKKKRGRPRKYGPDGTNVALGLSPLPPRKVAAEPTSSGEKARRGRPPGTGWKQKLAPLGEWMNSSAGSAFTPHVLHVNAREDIAAKILAFAQQRSRALCIMSANGSISSITLRQPTNPGATVTYEGRFEILCLSGSYLVPETGSPRNRIGGISISICSGDGHMIGGAIGGRLIAASPVQVIACSFVHGNSAKEKPKPESETKDETYTPEPSTGQNLTPTLNADASTWLKIPQTDIDLTRG